MTSQNQTNTKKVESIQPEQSDHNGSMPFLSHLDELRSCLGKAFLGIFVGTSICLFWASSIFSFLTSPLSELKNQLEFIGTAPAEAFIVKLKVSIVAGILFSLPYSFFQFWKFISPGLHQNERKTALPFVFFSSFFFLAGVAFCFYVTLPFVFPFFVSEYQSIGVKPTIRIGEYLSFVMRLMTVFGLVFEMPVLTYFLAKVNLITPERLTGSFRYAVIVIFIVAGILTPPDVATQLLLAGPLLVLYGLCILIAKFVVRTKKPTPQN
jgi:sec-independent protein translocase protein TatC